MRRFNEPVKTLFTGAMAKPPKVASVKEDERKAQEAQQEAERKARAALAAQERGGRSNTLFGAISAQSQIASQRQTLGGL